MSIMHFDKLEKCSCQHEENGNIAVATFYCKNPKCLNHKQVYYCERCSELHDHGTVLIVKETEKQYNQWQKFKNDLENQEKAASQNYKVYKALIEYLEKIQISIVGAQMRSMSHDYKVIQNVKTDVETFFENRLKELYLNFKLIELLELEKTLEDYKQQTEKVQYLSELTNDHLWKFYKEAVLCRTLESQVGFTQENKESFQLLKFRSLEEKMLQVTQYPGQNDQPQQMQQVPKLSMEEVDKVTSLETKISIFIAQYGEIERQEIPKIYELQKQLAESQEESKKLILAQKKQEEINECLQKMVAMNNDQSQLFLQDSLILTMPDQKQLIKLFLNYENFFVKTTLLYQGSKHGWTAANFHDKCDNIKQILVIVKASNGHTFGGYTSQGWNKNLHGVYIPDSTSFLFNINNRVKFSLLSTPHKEAIYNQSDYGPTFGSGPDLYLYNGMNSGNNTSSLGTTYHLPNGQSSTYLAGASPFTCSEVEVYSLKVLA